MDEQSLIYRLRKRAEIRRQISTRKSVQEGKPDRIADLLEEAASELEAWEDAGKQIIRLGEIQAELDRTVPKFHVYMPECTGPIMCACGDKKDA
jgi:vacuolar-type H+-ATPase subunit I/STV1